MDSTPTLESRLDAAGLNLRGALDVARYDALVPSAWRSPALGFPAHSALVIASGGRALWEAFSRSPEWTGLPDAGHADTGHPEGLDALDDPLDAYTRRVLDEIVEGLVGEGDESVALLAFERHGDEFADFVALGREVGLGAPSRLGLLVHPVYGPWLSIRAVLLSTRRWPLAEPLAGFDPCPSCPAPCADACPVRAPTPAGFDLQACVANRRVHSPCALDCAARRACVLGPEHAYLPEALAHHMGRSAA